MRHLILAALAGTMLAAPALAEPHGGHHGRGHHGWGHEGGFHREARWHGERYRWPGYVHPYGYGYRRWGVGYRLPPAYFVQRYWIADPGYYSLPPALPGTRWIRVGPDALLINIIDGTVIQAVRRLYR